jgi:hypothetical protein
VPPTGDGRRQVVVERIAVERLGVEQELAALGARNRGGDTDLAAELVGVVDFALVDALDLVLVPE